MTNNPAYRQNWILDFLKEKPTIGFSELFSKYFETFSKSEVTYSKDWNIANRKFSTYQELINNAKLEESIAQEKEAVKRNILSKNDALEILTEIANGKAKKIEGEIFMPSFAERRGAIQTMAELQGWKSTIKTDLTTNGESLNQPKADLSKLSQNTLDELAKLYDTDQERI